MVYQQYITLILTELEEFQEKDSGWTLHLIVKLEVNIIKLNPMKGNTYIKLPKQIEGVTSYHQYKDNLNFSSIKFPVAIKDVSKFEKQNDISVNIYGLINKEQKFSVVPLHLISQKRDHHMNLLRVEEEENYANKDSGDKEDGNEQESRPQSLNFHYVWIKDLSRIVSRQLSKNDERKHICERCLHYFTSIEKLVYHSEDCKKVNDCKIVLPKPGRNIIEFKNFKYKEKVLFIIYADCESLLKPVEDVQVKTSNTEVFQRHEVFDIGYYLKCSFDDALSSYRSWPNDEKPTKWFALELLGIAKEYDKMIK